MTLTRCKTEDQAKGWRDWLWEKCGGCGKDEPPVKLNMATRKWRSNPETYEVRADGEVITCEPATVLPMAQRYFLF